MVLRVGVNFSRFWLWYRYSWDCCTESSKQCVPTSINVCTNKGPSTQSQIRAPQFEGIKKITQLIKLCLMILLKANNTFGAWESIKGPVLSHNTASLRTKRCLMVHGKCWMSSRIIPHENKNRIYLNNCLQYYSIFPLFYCVFHRKQEVEQVEEMLDCSLNSLIWSFAEWRNLHCG